jgi:hypothetical protein
VECWGDDVPEGEVTSFPKAVQKKGDETVVFGWILWPSREARDHGMPKAMAHGRLMQETNPMPFDGKRMIYRGFESMVEVNSINRGQTTNTCFGSSVSACALKKTSYVIAKVMLSRFPIGLDRPPGTAPPSASTKHCSDLFLKSFRSQDETSIGRRTYLVH